MDEARTMLHRHKILKHEIDSYEERIERLRSQMESATVRLSHSPSKGMPEHDKLASQIARLLEIEAALAEKTIAYENACADIEGAIKQLPEQQRIIMWYRYIDGMGWKKIARKSNYSVDHCFAIHRAAFDNLTVNNSFFCDIV